MLGRTLLWKSTEYIFIAPYIHTMMVQIAFVDVQTIINSLHVYVCMAKGIIGTLILTCVHVSLQITLCYDDYAVDVSIL